MSSAITRVIIYPKILWGAMCVYLLHAIGSMFWSVNVSISLDDGKMWLGAVALILMLSSILHSRKSVTIIARWVQWAAVSYILWTAVDFLYIFKLDFSARFYGISYNPVRTAMEISASFTTYWWLQCYRAEVSVEDKPFQWEKYLGVVVALVGAWFFIHCFYAKQNEGLMSIPLRYTIAILCLSVSWAIVHSKNKGLKIGIGVVFLSAILAMLATKTRCVAIGFAVYLFILGVRGMNRRRIIIAVSSICFLCAIFFMASKKHNLNFRSMSNRMHIWKGTIAAINDEPFDYIRYKDNTWQGALPNNRAWAFWIGHGFGMNTIKTLWPVYRIPRIANKIDANNNGKKTPPQKIKYETFFTVSHAHNEWLQLTVERGVLGVIFAQGLLLYILWLVRRKNKKTNNALLAMFVCVAVISTVDCPLDWRSSIWFAMCIGIALAMRNENVAIKCAPKKQHHTKHTKKRKKRKRK